VPESERPESSGEPDRQAGEAERPADPQRGPADPSPPAEGAEGPSAQSVRDQICRDILAIHSDSYGSGAEVAEAHVVRDTVIVILDGLELLPNEQFLLQTGKGDAVVALRDQFQKAIEGTFRAAIERATGRRVIGFTSHVQLEEPRFSVEVFRLDPQ
jgi:uncharacterized protein YbcI